MEGLCLCSGYGVGSYLPVHVLTAFNSCAVCNGYASGNSNHGTGLFQGKMESCFNFLQYFLTWGHRAPFEDGVCGVGGGALVWEEGRIHIRD